MSITGANVTFTLQGVNNYIADSATLSIGLTARTDDLVNLNYTGTDTVNALFIDGVRKQAAGQWGAIGSGAANEDLRSREMVLYRCSLPFPSPPRRFFLASVFSLACNGFAGRRANIEIIPKSPFGVSPDGLFVSRWRDYLA